MADESKTGGEEMRAVVASGPGDLKNLSVASFAKPAAGAGQAVVKIQATGLNPVDWKMVCYNFLIKSFPAVVGCDYAGVVTAVGEGVTNLAVGDNVFGFAQLGRPGTFAEFIEVDASWAFKRPESLSVNDASVSGVAALTAALSLWGPVGSLEGAGVGTLAEPATTEPLFIVWGGASTVGLYVTQFANAAGLKVISVASKKNHELVTSYGASYTVDYHDEDAVAQIKAIVGDKTLRFGFDCVGAATATTVASLLTGTPDAPASMTFIAEAPTTTPDNVKATHVLLAYAHGKEELGAFLKKFAADVWLPGIASGKFKALPVKVLEGLEGVIEGLNLLAQHKVSGTKLTAVLA